MMEVDDMPRHGVMCSKLIMALPLQAALNLPKHVPPYLSIPEALKNSLSSFMKILNSSTKGWEYCPGVAVRRLSIASAAMRSSGPSGAVREGGGSVDERVWQLDA